MRNKFGFYDTWQNTQQPLQRQQQQQLRQELEAQNVEMEMEAAASVEKLFND